MSIEPKTDASVTMAKPALDIAHGDVVNTFLVSTESGLPIDPEVEKRVVRKIDRRLMPLLYITYLVAYLDKTVLGYAAVFGLKKDVGLVGSQYSWVSSILYFGYLIFEYPTSYAMQKVSVTKWLAANVFFWGCATACIGAGRNFGTLMGLRFVLGAFEACSTPALMFLSAMWYTREEQPIRIGWWITATGFAGAFGGLFAFGIGHIQGSLEPWRYQFIIIGGASAVWGILIWILGSENALSASWLTEEEKRVAIERLREDQTGVKNKEFKFYQFKEAILDWKTWLYVLMGISSMIVNSYVANFGGLVVQGFGWSTLNTLLLQIPFGVAYFISAIVQMYGQKYLPGERRCFMACVVLVPSLAGAIGMYASPRSSKVGLLICYYLTGLFASAYTAILTLITANTGGATKRSTTSALFFIAFCAGNIIGPFSFKESEAPVYTSGVIAVIVSFSSMLILFIIYAIYARWLNQRKAQALAAMGLSEEEIAQQRDANAFRDLTDKENPFFHYRY